MKKISIVSFVLHLFAPVVILISWYLSSLPTIEKMPSIINFDKVVHFVCFGGLAGCCTFWFNRKSWSEHFFRNFLICVCFVSFYGIIDEIHQSFVVGRSCSIFDWCADTLGAFLGAFLGGVIIKKLFIFL
ncbi:MAG: VanZ family protein [Treponema sp.]|nr:VanZ family protein [Treponema sp.]MBQ7882594.1 VanZ family protein [Treponema sp.]